MTQPRRRKLSWGMVMSLSLVWVMLWADLSPANVLVGVLIGVIVTLALPLPSIEFKGRIHPIAAARLLARLLFDLAHASFQVAGLALNPSRVPRGGVIRVHLRNESDLYLTLTALLTTLVPGSLVVEAHRQTGVLYLHVLDVEALGGIEKVRADTLEVERRVMEAFASDDELAAAGLRRRRRAEQGTEPGP